MRGLNPWPVAKTALDGKALKIYAGRPAEKKPAAAPGTVSAENGAIFVACGENTAYEITELQLEGAKRMSAADFLRGHPLDGKTLG